MTESNQMTVSELFSQALGGSTQSLMEKHSYSLQTQDGSTAYKLTAREL